MKNRSHRDKNWNINPTPPKTQYLQDNDENIDNNKKTIYIGMKNR